MRAQSKSDRSKKRAGSIWVGLVVLGVLVGVGGALRAAPAPGIASGGVWYCAAGTDPEYGDGHFDGEGWAMFTAPDGEHVSWGEGSCYDAHTAFALE